MPRPQTLPAAATPQLSQPPALAGRGEGSRVDRVQLSPACGVRIDGIDCAQPLSSVGKAAIDKAFLAHHVVVFPGQQLSREAQFRFAANFGPVEVHGAHRGERKRDGVAHIMSNLDDEGRPRVRLSKAANYHWHTDKPYHRAPPLLTMLYAVSLPPEGGDTEFANMALAYEALPERMQHRIEGLRVVFRPAFDAALPGSDHPLVRTHPETGRKSLYIGNHSTGIRGLVAADGRGLLDALLAHATQPRFVYTHRWRLGDLVMWDNRCLLHRAANNFDSGRYARVMHRSVVTGSVPL